VGISMASKLVTAAFRRVDAVGEMRDEYVPGDPSEDLPPSRIDDVAGRHQLIGELFRECTCCWLILKAIQLSCPLSSTSASVLAIGTPQSSSSQPHSPVAFVSKNTHLSSGVRIKSQAPNTSPSR